MRGDAYRPLFVRSKQEEVQEDFMDQRVFDHLFSETWQIDKLVGGIKNTTYCICIKSELQRQSTIKLIVLDMYTLFKVS